MGSWFDVTVTVTNHGSVPATGTRLVYAATGALSVIGAVGDDADCTVGAGKVECALGDLDAGFSRNVTVHLAASSSPGSGTHVVAAASAGSEPNPDPHPGAVIGSTPVGLEPTGPVPLSLGAGRNFLGTGGLAPAAAPLSDAHTLAVSAYCTDKVNGDRYQSGYTGGICTGSPNAEYRTSGYRYEIDVPATVSEPLGLWVWDGSYNKFCTGTVEGSTCVDDPSPAVDYFLSGGQAISEPFTFTVTGADATPADPDDDPVLCTRTLTAATPFELTFLGSPRWNQICTLPPGSPAGTYGVRVTNAGTAANPKANGTNRFGLVAASLQRSTDPAQVLCARQSNPTCPVVSARGASAVAVSTANTTATVPLASIPAHDAGKELRLDAFDPGEGVTSIRILRPTAGGGWAPATFRWTSTGMTTPILATSLDVSQSRFNGRLVTIRVDLTGYAPDPGHEQWLVEYRAASPVVTDVTTWDAAIETPAPA